MEPWVPKELWMLWDAGTRTGWVLSLDSVPDSETFLVAFSEAEAQDAAEHQNASYGLSCFPVRVK